MDSVIKKPITVEDAEALMLEMEQAECPVFHHFAPGLYIREVRMRAGTFAIGHHQNFAQMNIFVRGKVLMFLEDGGKRVLEAPQAFLGKSGRKVGLVLEDMIWHNIFPNPDNETDIEKLEARFLTKSDTWKTNRAAQRLMEVQSREPDRADYVRALAEFGIPHEVALAVSQNEADYRPIPSQTAIVAESPIHGSGLFATAPVVNGGIVMAARVHGMRTQAGRFTNHSVNPNCEMREIGGDIFLCALRDITGCEGGRLGEELTVDYRQALKLAGREALCRQ